MENRPLLVSVVVCTYNRAQLLKNCIRSLVKQSMNRRYYEVLVVDNNSTDDTEKVVNRFSRNHPNIRLVMEKKQGLSHARNLGWKEAKGRFVAYIDDDAVAQTDWVEQIAHFVKSHPDVQVFGGPYKRYFLTPPPLWFPSRYGTLNLGKRVKQIYPPKEWLTGTNMVFKKSLFEKYGGFDTNLGLKGKKTIYGEETDLMLKLHKRGEQMYYVPTIKVNHLVAPHKYTMWWLLKSDFFHSYSSSQFLRTRFAFLKGTLFLSWSLFIFPSSLFNTKAKMLKTRIYYGLSRIFLAFGQMAGSLYSL